MNPSKQWVNGRNRRKSILHILRTAGPLNYANLMRRLNIYDTGAITRVRKTLRQMEADNELVRVEGKFHVIIVRETIVSRGNVSQTNVKKECE